MQWTGDLIDVAMTDSRQSLLEGESILANIKTNYACRTSTKRLEIADCQGGDARKLLEDVVVRPRALSGYCRIRRYGHPEINIAILSGHDMLFLGEKGQAKSRLMRSLVRFLDEWLPYLDLPELSIHEDPYRPMTNAAKKALATRSENEIPIGWWHRDQRYAERLSPGTKFADVIGEIDPSRLIGGVGMGTEEALHFGLIPRMHRGIFAMNELRSSTNLSKSGCSTSSKNATSRSVDIRSSSISTSAFCSPPIRRPTTEVAR